MGINFNPESLHAFLSDFPLEKQVMKVSHNSFEFVPISQTTLWEKVQAWFGYGPISLGVIVDFISDHADEINGKINDPENQIKFYEKLNAKCTAYNANSHHFSHKIQNSAIAILKNQFEKLDIHHPSPLSKEVPSTDRPIKQPANRIMIPKGVFQQMRGEVTAKVATEKTERRREDLKNGTPMPNKDALKSIALRHHKILSIELLDLKEKEIFQNQRMNLSNTIQRNPKEKENWLTANAMLLPLVQKKTTITIEDQENIQKKFNHGLVMYLNVDAVQDKKDQLNGYLEWLNAQLLQCDKGDANPIVVAAHAYRYFLLIHPYADGNGRMGRLMMDLVLQRAGLPPANLGALTSDAPSLVKTIEADVNELVLSIKQCIVGFCKQTNQPSPFLN